MFKMITMETQCIRYNHFIDDTFLQEKWRRYIKRTHIDKYMGVVVDSMWYSVRE